MDFPLETINWLIEHRLGREEKVIEKLSTRAGIALLDLVPVVYDDVDPSLHSFAQLSLLAHLIKLEQEQRASSHGEGDHQQWQML